MLAALALVAATIAATSPDYAAWTRAGDAHFKFYALADVHGPFKFYVPSRAAPVYVVPPDRIEQKWPPGAKSVEVTFPLSLVGGMRQFRFDAVTVTADSEYLFVRGEMPH